MTGRLCEIMLAHGDERSPALVARLRAALDNGSPALAARAENAWDNCMRGRDVPAEVLREAGAILAALRREQQERR
jgi:hypothetical protein